MSSPNSRYVESGDLRLHYLEAGEEREGPPVVLLHGWPTSSFLYRDVMPHIAAHRRVLALDLPGFGRSDKPVDAIYSFGFYRRALGRAFDALGIDRLGLCVHDMGGPIGLDWAVRNPQRIERLALLNTLVYPDPSWAVVAFVLAVRLPIVRSILASPWGLKLTMNLGTASPVSDDVVRGVQEPFTSRPAREALLRSASHLSPKGFAHIAEQLPAFHGLDVPVRIVYGAKDRVLPDVAETMARVRKDLPQAEITRLSHCGHFLQEDAPDEVGRLLAAFFAADAPPAGAP